MGARTFLTRARGTDAESAFHSAVEEAQYHHGYAGRTGTIAEKNSFTQIPDDEVGDAEPREYANQLIDEKGNRQQVGACWVHQRRRRRVPLLRMGKRLTLNTSPAHERL